MTSEIQSAARKAPPKPVSTRSRLPINAGSNIIQPQELQKPNKHEGRKVYKGLLLSGLFSFAPFVYFVFKTYFIASHCSSLLKYHLPSSRSNIHRSPKITYKH